MDKLKQVVTNNDTWYVSEGHYEGKPFLLRFRPHLQPFINAGRYNQRIIFVFRYDSANDTFMPVDTDLERMKNVEDSLVDTLENDLQAVLAFVYTAQKKREWHWYSSNLNITKERINKTVKKFGKLPVKITVEDDPTWGEYQQVLEETDSIGHREFHQ